MYCIHDADIFNEVKREFFNNLLWVYIGHRYRESKHFRQAVIKLVYNICENNPTSMVASMVHEFLKLRFFFKLDYRKGVYKEIRYKTLPVLWKNHRSIERRKFERLNLLAYELDKNGRHIEAHVIRTIVKPYIRDLNLKWRKMTALDKLRTVQL